MFTNKHKRVTVSVINDLATDQRVQRTCSVLQELGYEVLLVGRKLSNSPSVDNLPYKTKRLNLIFTQGPLFYFFFNVRLFLKLLFTKSELLYANDLDTLWPNYVISKLKNIDLVYDSHEIFCEVPELQSTPVKKQIWESIERRIVPKLKKCITVNQSIANYFKDKYKTSFTVVRNIPLKTVDFVPKSRKEMHMPQDKKIVIFQGAGINIDRGAEELVQAMQFVEGVKLYIIGGGDVFPALKELTSEFKLDDKIEIISKIPKNELLHYTYNSDLGITIDKDTNLNYHFSLPNKIFDYIQAGIPVLASKLPEVEGLIKKYDLGDVIEGHDPKQIAEKITAMLSSDRYPTWRKNTIIAAQENTWETEKQNLVRLLNTIDTN